MKNNEQDKESTYEPENSSRELTQFEKKAMSKEHLPILKQNKTKVKIEDIIEAEPDKSKSSEVDKKETKTVSLKFWTISEKGEVEISPSLMHKTLSRLGIYNYYVNNDKDEIPILVRIDSNRLARVGIPFIENELMKIIQVEGNQEVADAFLKSTSASSNGKLFTLPKLQKDLIKDSEKNAYFFFKNAIARVDANGIHKVDYKDSEGVIWESQIIDHEFTPVPRDMLFKESDFYKFLVDITNHTRVISKKRLNHLMSLLGYLLHSYKNPTTPKAVALMDEVISDSPNGGTGKSLLSKSISKLRKVTQEDGKNFNASQQFSYQQVELDTKIVLFDDVHRKFDFEKLFPVITEGIQVERKYKNRITIPYSDSPKVLITTNYAINGTGSSFRRRLHEFQLSQFFNDENTPFRKFGRVFFEGWDVDQWNMFYTVMLTACQQYLANGVVISEPLNLKDKKLIYSTSPEFSDFAKENIELNKEHNKKTLFTEFKKSYPDFENYKQRTFSNWIVKYAEINGYNIKERHSGLEYFVTIVDEKKP